MGDHFADDYVSELSGGTSIARDEDVPCCVIFSCLQSVFLTLPSLKTPFLSD